MDWIHTSTYRLHWTLKDSEMSGSCAICAGFLVVCSGLASMYPIPRIRSKFHCSDYYSLKLLSEREVK